MTLLRRKRVIAAKIEATSGTAETVLAADAAFNVYDIAVTQDIEMAQREAQGGFAMLAAVAEGRKGTVSFKVDASWDGTATEPSWADTFLPACGWCKTGQVFTPRTEAPGTNVKTLTIAVYTDGVRKLLYGCAGNFRLVCATGKTAVCEFDFTGIWGGVTDAAILAPTYPTVHGLRYAASTTTWDSVALCLENLTLDSGNEVSMRECAADVSGFHGAIINNRMVKITGNPEARTVAGQDRYGKLLDSSQHALTWGLDGPTNSVITIAAPQAQIIAINEGERNGLLTDEIEWSCNRNGSNLDQECSITFTAAT
jgi:hypothetical protein